MMQYLRSTSALLGAKFRAAYYTDQAAQMLGDGLDLKQYDADGSSWQAIFGSRCGADSVVERLCIGVAEFFKRHGGTNYLEFTMDADGLGPIVVSFQRKQGQTPHALRVRAEEDAAELRTMLETMAGSLRACMERIEDDPDAWAAYLNQVEDARALLDRSTTKG
jgi:hypothetical protein